MTLYAKLNNAAATSTPTNVVPVHVSQISGVNVRQIVQQLTPHLAQDQPAVAQVPAASVQGLNLQELTAAQMLVQSGSQIPGLLAPPPAAPAVAAPAIRSDLGVEGGGNRPPPPPPTPPCTSVPNLVASAAATAAQQITVCQNFQNSATAAVQAAAAAPDCATQLSQANAALSALAQLDDSAQQAAGCVDFITYLATQTAPLKCSQTVLTDIANAKTQAQSSANQANQIATSPAVTLLLTSAQHWQSVAIAVCGQQAAAAGPQPNSIRAVVMWYGMDFELDEKTTQDLENLCNYGTGLAGIAGPIIAKAVTGAITAIASAVLAAVVVAVPELLERALKSADQGNGVTLHFSIIPWVGLSIFGVVVGAAMATQLETLLEAGALGIGVGGNPITTIFWVTGN